jgi:imidazole glycerol phosphate synthase glutamine amidotransferase subunit
MREVRVRRLESAVKAFTGQGGPLLGICLGMQILFEGSEEAPMVPGLGLLPGHFAAFNGPGLKVPHMGWSSLDFLGTSRSVYFVHSYFLPGWTGPAPDQLGIAFYGRPFVAAFRAGGLAGLQFHPEKSGREGLALLKEALTWS